MSEYPIPDWMRETARQVAALTGTTRGLVPLVIMVPIGDDPASGDAIQHDNGDIEIRPPVATMTGNAFTIGA